MSDTEHTHAFDDVLFDHENEQRSRDVYTSCACRVVRHVYTWTPGNIRHETVYPPGRQSYDARACALREAARVGVTSDTITNAQIRAMLAAHDPREDVHGHTIWSWVRSAIDAIPRHGSSVEAARRHCADLFNATFAAKGQP